MLPTSQPGVSAPIVTLRYTDDEGNLKRVVIVIPNEPYYGMLNPEKIRALNKVPYEKFRESLGLDPGYDVAVKIVDKEGRELLYYGEDFSKARIIASFSRAVTIYPDYYAGINDFLSAILTVYVFKY